MKNHSWSKDEIVKLVKIWPSLALPEIAKELGRDKQSVQQMAHHIRKLGYPLARKKSVSVHFFLIREAMKEAGIDPGPVLRVD